MTDQPADPPESVEVEADEEDVAWASHVLIGVARNAMGPERGVLSAEIEVTTNSGLTEKWRIEVKQVKDLAS